MSETEKLESCLRVVANRCRNLRKAIERAKTWERAANEGQQLNDEQMQSIKSIEGKETLLSELQEILKKQTAIAQPHTAKALPSTPPISKRRAKAERAAKAKEGHLEKESSSSATSVGKTEGGRGTDAPDDLESFQEKTSSDAGSAAEYVPLDQGCEDSLRTDQPQVLAGGEASNPRNENHGEAETAAASSEQMPSLSVHRDTEDLRKQMDAIQMQHTEHLNRDRKDTIRMTLNLFHVVDFLRQKGSREALLAFFESPAAQRCAKRVDSLDLDLLCYFNVMLTSPNGNVPHNEAVDVSTAHCLEFLKGSVSPAFKGTSYSKLSEIATTIGSCPILTERGLKDDGRQGRGKRKSRGRGKSEVSSNGREPSHLMNDPAADVRLP